MFQVIENDTTNCSRLSVFQSNSYKACQKFIKKKIQNYPVQGYSGDHHWWWCGQQNDLNKYLWIK